MNDVCRIRLETMEAMLAAYYAMDLAVGSRARRLGASRPDVTGVWDSGPDLDEALATAEANRLFARVVHDSVREHGIATTPGSLVVPSATIDRALRRAGADSFESDDDRSKSPAVLRIEQLRAERDQFAAEAATAGALTPAELTAYRAATEDGHGPYAAWLLATMTPDEIAAQLRDDVYAEAGLSDEWNPALGLEANDVFVRAVYEYYPALYELDPDMQWLGLASVAAPQFYASFHDIADLRRHAETGGNVFEVISVEPQFTISDGIELTAEEAAEALWFMETTFLDMQQQIFHDMAVQHYAYQIGGTELIEAWALGAGLLEFEREPIVTAWHGFDDGELVTATEALVDREQRIIIQDDYDEIWAFSLASKAMITAASLSAADDPSGGESFAEHRITPELHAGWEVPNPAFPVPIYDPWRGWRAGEIVWDTPDVSITIDGLDPTANVANEVDRMLWIEGEVTPNLIEWWEVDPDGLLEVVRRDLDEASDGYRMVPELLR